MALKRKHKAKSSTLTTGAPTTAAHASGSSQAGPSSHGHPEHGHTSSLGQAGVSSQSIPVHGGQSLQVAGDPTTYHLMSQIRTRYKAPGTSSSTRYAFLVDTTRTISVRILAGCFVWVRSVFL